MSDDMVTVRMPRADFDDRTLEAATLVDAIEFATVLPFLRAQRFAGGCCDTGACEACEARNALMASLTDDQRAQVAT